MKPKTRAIWGLLALAAVWLAVNGQRRLVQRDYVLDGVTLLAVGVILFLAVVSRRQSAEPALWPRSIDRVTRSQEVPLVKASWRKALLVATLLLAGIAFLSLAKNHFTWPGLLCWWGALLTWLLATWQIDSQRPAWRLPQWSTWQTALRRGGVSLRANWSTLLLLGILFLSLFFRLYHIDSLPTDPESDHVEASQDVNDILHGQYRIFFPRNTGREPTQFYLTAALAHVFGFGFVTLKLTMALVGALNVIPMYWLGKELLDKRLGLLAAFMMAISYWHTIISRIGLRIALAPLWTTITLYLLLRAFRTGRRNDYLLSGISLGLGLYGYMAFRMVPLLIVVLFALKALLDRGPAFDGKRFATHFALLVITSAIVFLPLLRYMYDDPKMYWYRALTRTTPLETGIQRSATAVFADNVKNALLMFNWIGDDAWPEAVEGKPSLDYVTGALLVLGVAYVLYLLVLKRRIISVYLLVSAFVLLLPSTLAIAFPAENPSHLRASAVIPVILLVAALAAYIVGQQVLRALRGGTGIVLVCLAGIVLLWQSTSANYHIYFHDYYEHYRRSAWNATDMARVITSFGNTLGDVHDAYLVCSPYWIDGRAVSLMLRDMRWENFLYKGSDAQPQLAEPRNHLYIFKPDNAEVEQWLYEHYPSGQLLHFQAFEPDKDFMIFYAPALLQ